MTGTMRPAESRAGLVSCTCWDEHASLKIKNSGIPLLLMVTFYMLGMFSSYLTIIIRKSMQAFIPFISQAAGEPPANGILAVFVEIGAFFGYFAVIIFFISINQRNIKNNKIIKNLNFIALLSILACLSGTIIVASFPVGYVDLPNKFEWVLTVLYEHSFGAMLIIGCGIFYQYVLLGIWWFLPGTSKKEKYVEIGFAVTYIILTLLSIYPMSAYVLQQMGSNPFDFETMKTLSYDTPRKYTTIHLICSILEWSFVLLTFINLSTFYKDLKRVSCRVVFRHKSCRAEDIEDMKRISLKVIF